MNYKFIARKFLNAPLYLVAILSINALCAEDSPSLFPCKVIGSMQLGEIPGFLKINYDGGSVNFSAGSIGSVLLTKNEMIVVRISPGFGIANQVNLIISKDSQSLDSVMKTISVALTKKL